MKVFSHVVTAGLLSTAAALHLAPRSDPPHAVSLPLQRRNIDPQTIPARDRARFRKRQDRTLAVPLDNRLSLYFADVTLGTPPQKLQVHLDTGSSDLWVNVADSDRCQRGQCEGGVYNPDASSTHKIVNTDFNISYVDGTEAIGDYVSDTLGFGAATLENFQFGTGQQSTSTQGVLGIGFEINEVQVNRANRDSYPNLPAALKNNGHIASSVYSLWLNDLDSSTGQILFGGVDSSKYTGTLETVPMIQQAGEYYQFLVALTGLTVNGQKSTSSALPAAVLLDSGATLTYLPNKLAQEIFNQVNAVWVEQVGAAYASCNLANTARTLDFEFSGKTISVPYNELFLDAGTTSSGQKLQLENGEPACIFGISQVGDHIAVMGDTFLRSAYVVYDLENKAVSLAQTVFNATSSSVRDITSAGGDVPGAQLVSNPIAAVEVGTEGARLGGPGTNDAGGVLISSSFAALVAALAMAVTTW